MEVGAQEIGALGLAAVVVNNVLRFAGQMLKERYESTNGQGRAQRERDEHLRKVAENTDGMRAQIESLSRAQGAGKLSCSWSDAARAEQRALLTEITHNVKELRRLGT